MAQYNMECNGMARHGKYSKYSSLLVYYVLLEYTSALDCFICSDAINPISEQCASNHLSPPFRQAPFPSSPFRRSRVRRGGGASARRLQPLSLAEARVRSTFGPARSVARTKDAPPAGKERTEGRRDGGTQVYGMGLTFTGRVRDAYERDTCRH